MSASREHPFPPPSTPSQYAQPHHQSCSAVEPWFRHRLICPPCWLPAPTPAKPFDSNYCGVTVRGASIMANDFHLLKLLAWGALLYLVFCFSNARLVVLASVNATTLFGSSLLIVSGNHGPPTKEQRQRYAKSDPKGLHGNKTKPKNHRSNSKPSHHVEISIFLHTYALPHICSQQRLRFREHSKPTATLTNVPFNIDSVSR